MARVGRTIGLIVLAVLLGGCLVQPGASLSRLTYTLPTTLTVKAGQALVGTDIIYQKMEGDSARLLVKGQPATKRKGDSVDWKGSPLEGVTVDMRLRVVWYTEEELRVAGTVKIVVEGVNPKAGVIHTTSSLHFTGPVAYGIAKGARLPGTTLYYEGQTEEGAQLGGLDEYPFRKMGDSILWEGQLRPGVYIRLDVRAVQFDDRSLRVAGLASLWLGE